MNIFSNLMIFFHIHKCFTNSQMNATKNAKKILMMTLEQKKYHFNMSKYNREMKATI